VPPHAPALLAQAMLQLIDAPELRQRLGANAAAKARRDFDEMDFFTRHREIYRKLLTKKKLL